MYKLLFRSLLAFAMPLVLLCKGHSQQPVSYFRLSQVSLLPSTFKVAQEKDKAYIFSLNPDRLGAPYLTEAGLSTDVPYYGNWESTGLAGHIGGHYVTALSIMYAATGDSVIYARLAYMLALWKKAQDANGNGYLGGVPDGNALWDEVRHGHIKADAFSLNGRWVPLYNIHKTLAGLRDAYLYAGNESAKTMFLRMCDWAVEEFAALSDAQMQELLKSEHGGLNEIFIDAYGMEPKKEYADLAVKFSHKAILDPLLSRQDKLTGLHANTQIPKVIGFEKIGSALGKTDWENAASFFWKEVVNKRSVAFGGNSAYEHFNPVNDFSGMLDGVQGPETCNSNNMLKLTQDLYSRNMRSYYMDYFENVLYNHILSSQDRHTGGLVYFTPIRPDAYRVYSQPSTSFWCCVGSGMENHGKYAEMIYAKSGGDLIVNLFIPSVLNWPEKGLVVEQTTSFPREEKSRLRMKLKRPESFTVYIRHPEWIKEKILKVEINGVMHAYPIQASGYIAVKRSWKNGDLLQLHLPMRLEKEQLPDKSSFYAFKYGPVLLAAATDTINQVGLYADDSRGGHIASGPLPDFSSVPVVKMSAIPIRNRHSSDNGLNFSLAAYSDQNQRQYYTLQPFYTIDASRYIMYWPVVSYGSNVARFRNEVLARKDEKLSIAKQTVDAIYCGEQQSELDHFIRYTISETGLWGNAHYRSLDAPIAYRLKKVDHAKRLYFAFAGMDHAVSLKVKLGTFETIVELVADGSRQTRIIALPDTSANLSDLLQLIPVGDGRKIKVLEIRALK